MKKACLFKIKDIKKNTKTFEKWHKYVFFAKNCTPTFCLVSCQMKTEEKGDQQMKDEIETKMNRDIFQLVIDEVATAERIRKAIQDSKFTVVQIAEAIGVETQTVYLWKSAKRIPEIENFMRLSRLLDAKLDDLIVEKRK